MFPGRETTTANGFDMKGFPFIDLFNTTPTRDQNTCLPVCEMTLKPSSLQVASLSHPPDLLQRSDLNRTIVSEVMGPRTAKQNTP